MRWWGWGIPRMHPRWGVRAMLRLLRETVGGPQEPPAPRWRSAACAVAPRATARGRPRGAAETGSATTRVRDRSRRTRHNTPPAEATPTSCACVLASSRRRLTPCSTRAAPSSWGALMALCAKRSIAVVPFGGGTSVVGGVAPLRGAHAGGGGARHGQALPSSSRWTRSRGWGERPGGNARARAGAAPSRERG